MLEITIILIIFIMGLIFSLKYKTEDLIEGFEVNENIPKKCPTNYF